MEESSQSKKQYNNGSRRRSMLPHPAAKSTTQRLPMPGPTRNVTRPGVQGLNETKEKWISPMRPDSRNVSGTGKSMLPPPLPTLPRLRPTLDAFKGSTLANRPSLSGVSQKQNSTAEGPRRLSSVPKPSHARTSSAASVPSVKTKHSVHTRSMSHQVPSTTPPRTTAAGAMPSSRPLPPSSNTRRASTLAPAKPSFNTLQNHYTPRKNPTSRLPPVPTATNKSKRPTTSSSNVSSISNDHDPSTTTTSGPTKSQPSQQLLQELTHLHLLHSSALPTLNAWQASAHSHFHQRFTDLAGRHTELRDIAQAQQGLLNAHALGEWGMGLSGSMVGEKVERLSRNGGELMRMVEEGGKHARVVGVWEVWFEGVERVRARREGGGGGVEVDVEMIEGIGDGWKAEAMVLERELGYCARELEGFGNVKEGSGLGRLLGAWKALVRGLLEELDVLQWIEGEVMVKETGWVESKIRELGTGLDG